MYVLTELGYFLICHVKEKRKKKYSFENALVEKSESSTRNKNGLVEGLLLFSRFYKIFSICKTMLSYCFLKKELIENT